VAEALAGGDVGDVHLDQRRGPHLDRVHERVRVVGERARVEHDRGLVIAGLVDPGDELALVLSLPDLDVEAEFVARLYAQVGQIGVRGGAVDRRLALAQAAEVGAVEHQHPAALSAGHAAIAR
jgi:uncharacterized protein with von Willebrand factor type A (vWA) domain